uniref:Uncharacterized protein n=1 Tax=Panagrolaimus davidi TaxID=227884 RepID=A0A914P5C0_9BILA
MADQSSNNISPTNLSENDDIKLIIGEKEKHFDIMYEILTKKHFPNDPMTKSIGATSNEASNLYHEIIDRDLEIPYSVLAFINDKCIGCCLNYIITNVQKTEENPISTFNNEFAQDIHTKGSKIKVVFDEIERDYGFFIPECNELLKIDILFVDPEYKGLNGFRCVREIHFNSFLDCGQRIFRRRLADESETINLMFLKINESMPDPKMQS